LRFPVIRQGGRLECSSKREPDLLRHRIKLSSDDHLLDPHLTCRSLRRWPAFTTVAVMTLALAIGVNAAVFTVTNAVLFKGFRVVDRNDRILYIGTQKSGRGCCASYPDFLDWRAQATLFPRQNSSGCVFVDSCADASHDRACWSCSS
jgi:hypothetical protein